jgi:hypothetical protein
MADLRGIVGEGVSRVCFCLGIFGSECLVRRFVVIVVVVV